MPRPENIRICWVLVVWIAVVAFPAQAGRIVSAQVHMVGEDVSVDLRAEDLLDRRTESTINSGLPGTCVFRLRLESRERPIAERFVEQNLRLDLWEDVYRLQRGIAQQQYSSLEAADSAWSNLAGIQLARRSQLRPESLYRLVVQVAVRPLAPEDRERMSRYVRKHSGSGSEELSLDLGALFAGLFGGGKQEQVVRFETDWFRPGELEVRP